MAALALATSIYALLRIDSTRDGSMRNDFARTARQSAQLRADLRARRIASAPGPQLDRRVDVRGCAEAS